MYVLFVLKANVTAFFYHFLVIGSITGVTRSTLPRVWYIAWKR